MGAEKKKEVTSLAKVSWPGWCSERSEEAKRTRRALGTTTTQNNSSHCKKVKRRISPGTHDPKAAAGAVGVGEVGDRNLTLLHLLDELHLLGRE